jgi:uncharacterized protein (DUF3084 family)
METSMEQPMNELPAWAQWLGSGTGAAVVAYLLRILYRMDREGVRVDKGKGVVDQVYQDVLGHATQALEEHARDREEWRTERKELKDELALCRASHQESEKRLAALEKR